MTCGERTCTERSRSSRTKRVILFDIDGTVLDSRDFVFGAVRYSVGVHGHSYPKDKVLKKALGKSLLEFYEIIFPKGDILSLANAHRQFQAENSHLNKSFPRASEVLKILREQEFLMAAVSNRKRQSLLRSLEVTGLLKFFNVIVSADDVKNPKPHKEPLLLALNSLKVSPRNAYMIGDTENDILAGKNSGVKTIGATYGWLGKDIKKYQPDFVIDDIGEIVNIVK